MNNTGGNSNKDEEIRKKTLESYINKIFQCEGCGYMRIDKASKLSKSKYKEEKYTWCDICQCRQKMKVLTEKEIETVFSR